MSCASRAEAGTLADRLEDEGYAPVRRWRHLFVGVATKDEADTLAQRLHGAVEPGGELVYEVLPNNPFAVFGGLG
ncbi:MAG: SPOR domain-containing protein [Gaiellaceae bacterium]